MVRNLWQNELEEDELYEDNDQALKEKMLALISAPSSDSSEHETSNGNLPWNDDTNMLWSGL